MKNRILKIAFFLPTLNVGGIERVFITYANSLSEFYDVEFVLCKKEGILLKELSSKVNVYNLGNVRLANSFYYLRKYLKQNRLDCIITGGDYPNMVLVLASLHLSHRPKIVISQHNYFNIEIEHLGLWAKFSKIWTRIIYPYSHKIIAVSDGIMVARGDLGVEIPTEEIPVVQKMMIAKCNKAGKPVITATQMLDSMMRNPRPTRAEVSDVANAIYDGTDAIMLSGESANGDWPVESVQTMARIAEETEKKLSYETAVSRAKNHTPAVSGVISRAACNAANELKAAAIVTSTKSGATARRISQCRPDCPIVAVTPNEKVAKGLAFSFGVYSMVTPTASNTDEVVANAIEAAKSSGFVTAGETVVVAAGLDTVGSTNLLKVTEVK